MLFINILKAVTFDYDELVKIKTLSSFFSYIKIQDGCKDLIKKSEFKKFSADFEWHMRGSN